MKQIIAFNYCISIVLANNMLIRISLNLTKVKVYIFDKRVKLLSSKSETGRGDHLIQLCAIMLFDELVLLENITISMGGRYLDSRVNSLSKGSEHIFFGQWTSFIDGFT